MITVKYIEPNDLIIDDIVELGDNNSKTLGHFPRNAYYESAFRKQIIVATDSSESLAGYLLFRFVKTKNKLSITHLCVKESYRGQNVSDKLLQKLIEKYENLCRGIGLNCRDDYEFAKKKWRKLGFKPLETKRSRSKAENHLTYWWYEFANHDLFSNYINDNNKLSVVLDFNVIISLRDERPNDFEECNCLLDDWIFEDVEYYYATEIFNEIYRDSDNNRKKLTKSFLKKFKEIVCNASKIKVIQNDLNKILNGKTENDISDEKQLAEVIVSGIKYFVTMDTELLGHRKFISSKYGVNIYRPSEFIVEFDKINNREEYQPGRFGGTTFISKKIDLENLNLVIHKFLDTSNGERKSVFSQQIYSLVADKKNADLYRIIDNADNDVALIALKYEEDSISVRFLRILKCAFEDILFKQLINFSIKCVLLKSKKLLILEDENLSNEQRTILMEFQFIKKSNLWVKLILKGVVLSRELFEVNKILKYYLDETKYFKLINDVKHKDNVLFYLEKILWPLKFSDLNVPTYIIPIKPYWASQLFDYHTSEGTFFGALPTLMWNRENIYYRSVMPQIEKEKGRILWYASQNRAYTRSKSIISSSYLDEIIIDEAKKIFKRFESFGIYKWRDIESLTSGNSLAKIKAIKFSDTEVFSNDLSLQELKVIINEIEHKEISLQSVSKLSSKVFIEIYKKVNK